MEACVPADSPHQHAWSLEAGNRGASSSDPADETKGAPKIASGETNRDDEVVKEIYARTGAYVLGWQMFDEGEVGWPDPPPFRAPVFGLTTHARKAWVRQGGTTITFVTDGIESALEQARAAAGDKDVRIAGGTNVIQQCLSAGLLDELQVHLAPMLLGDGVQLFDHIGKEHIELENTRVDDSPRVTA